MAKIKATCLKIWKKPHAGRFGSGVKPHAGRFGSGVKPLAGRQREREEQARISSRSFNKKFFLERVSSFKITNRGEI